MIDTTFVWIASVIVGLSVLAWLVIDWLESAQPGERVELDPTRDPILWGQSEFQRTDALDVETELMLSYPLDPFAPTLWRPHAHENWAETQPPFAEAHSPQTPDIQTSLPDLYPGEAA